MVNGNGGEESAGKYQGNCFLLLQRGRDVVICVI